MTQYYGDFAEDDTVLIPFNTFSSDDPAASVTITNLADTDLHVHKDGGLTQTTTGATVVINFDSITGNHMATIDTSADAFYATGSEYAVRMEGTTVDGGTINAWIGAFSIERAGGALALIKAGVTLAAGAITDASLAGNMEIVFETDFATNYNTTRNAWVNNYTDIIGTIGNASFAAGALTSTEITSAAGITLANGAITDVSLAGNMEIVFETDFSTNYNTTRNAWVNNYTDFIGTIGAASLATDTITAAKIAADAITSSELATSAVEEIADAVLDEALSGHTTAGSLGKAVADIETDATAIKVVTDDQASAATTLVVSTAKAGTLSTTQASTNLTEATDDHYIGRTIIFTSGVLKDQASDITDYVGVNGVLTFSALTEAPSATDAFVIV